MFNQFDSRALGRTDCYAQRFTKVGTYAYNVVPGYGQSLSTDTPFTVKVEGDGRSEGASHNVQVRVHGKGFAVDQPEITVKVGDMVMWNGGDGAWPYAVVGEDAFFNSHLMVSECVYSHAFGTAGDYEWGDAFGSGATGLVRVRDPDCSGKDGLKKWREQLASGAMVVITGGKVDQRELDILTGQTVFFAIIKSEGGSITDKRLLDPVYAHDCGQGERVAA